jgi:hypothetical protein
MNNKRNILDIPLELVPICSQAINNLKCDHGIFTLGEFIEFWRDSRYGYIRYFSDNSIINLYKFLYFFDPSILEDDFFRSKINGRNKVLFSEFKRYSLGEK